MKNTQQPCLTCGQPAPADKFKQCGMCGGQVPPGGVMYHDGWNADGTQRPAICASCFTPADQA